MKVLVTGCTGFIGCHVVGTLIEARHRIAIKNNLWESSGRKIESYTGK
jgi:nucleoside-diphosphate-sugar epimerase